MVSKADTTNCTMLRLWVWHGVNSLPDKLKGSERCLGRGGPASYVTNKMKFTALPKLETGVSLPFLIEAPFERK